MKKIINFLKGGIIIILISNILFTPKTIINFIDVSKSVYYNGEYKLNRVKIDTIISFQSSDGDGSSSTNYKVYYSNKQKNINFSKDEILMFYEEYRNEFKYIDSTILENYYDKYKHKKNDSIWVWEHPIAPDHYTMNKENKLSTGLYVKRFFINLFFILVAIVSFFLIKKNIKFK